MQPNLKARPISRNQLIHLANSIRNQLQITGNYFPVDLVIEFVHLLAPGYRFEVLEEKDMGDNHGLTQYQDRIIQIREDVYDRACCGEGRDRMTIAHEIGHAILHTDTLISARDFGAIKPYEDPEWQAKAFAGHLLIPYSAVRSNNIEEIVKECRVSYDAACIAIRIHSK